MHSRRLRPFGLLVAAVLALAATVPGSASASFGTLSYRAHGPVGMPVDAEGTVTAQCRPDTHVLGGGQYVQAGFENSRVQSSAPFDGPDTDTIPDDGWRSRIDSFNGAQNTVTEYAICSTRQPHYRKIGYRTGDGPYVGGAQPKCPTRETALGGGVDVSPGGYDSSALLISRPAPLTFTGAWKGEAWVGLASVPNQRITVWVICGAAEVTYPTATNPVAGQSSGRTSAACPAATSLIGGGVQVPEPSPRNETDMLSITSRPLDGHDGNLVPDDRWRAEGDNLALPQQGGTVTATAICLQ